MRHELYDKLYNFFRERIGFESGITRLDILDAMFAEKNVYKKAQSTSAVDKLELQELWREIRAIMRKFRKNTHMFIISQPIGGGEWVFFVLKDSGESQWFIERIEKIKKGMFRVQHKCQEALDNKYYEQLSPIAIAIKTQKKKKITGVN